MSSRDVVAVALTRSERDLLVCALRLAEEHDADPAATRDLIDMLERAMPAEQIRRALEDAAA